VLATLGLLHKTRAIITTHLEIKEEIGIREADQGLQEALTNTKMTEIRRSIEDDHLFL
jgi:hypothetical protein